MYGIKLKSLLLKIYSGCSDSFGHLGAEKQQTVPHLVMMYYYRLLLRSSLVQSPAERLMFTLLLAPALVSTGCKSIPYRADE